MNNIYLKRLMIANLILVFMIALWTTCAVDIDANINKINSELNILTQSISNKRNLDSCSTTETGAECGEFDTGSWLNFKGQNNPESSIEFETFNQEREHSYGYNLSKNKHIIPLDGRLRLTHNRNADPIGHNLGRWYIEVNPDKVTNILINRSPNQSEDIVITQIYPDGKELTLNSRSLSNCGGEDILSDFQDAKFLKISAKILSKHISYDIVISQFQSDTKRKSATLLFIVFVTVTSSCLLVNVLCCLILYKKWNTRRQRTRRRNQIIEQNKQARLKKVTDTMHSMISGPYNSIQNTYAQSTGVVGLDNFESSSQVHLTNECCHILHSSCLRRWYENLLNQKHLKGPHCNTQNLVSSQPRTSEVEIAPTSTRFMRINPGSGNTLSDQAQTTQQFMRISSLQENIIFNS